MQYIMDSVPWYVWLLPAPIIIGVLLWFFGPFIIGIWNALPTKVKAVLIAIGTVGLAYLIGRSQGNKTARDRLEAQRKQAVESRRQIHDDVQKRDDKRIDDDLSKWLRDK